MGYGYLSDTESRRLGLHKLEPIPLKSLGPRPGYIRKGTLSIRHLATVVRKLLEADKADRIDVSREVLIQALAIYEAIIRTNEATP